MRFLLVMLVAVSAGCQAGNPEYAPAQRVQMSAAGLAELTEIVRTATNSPKITLAAEPFATSYILVVQPGAGKTPNVGFATGRLIEPPQTFHLQTDGKHCALWHVNAEKRYPLKEIACTTSAS